MLHHFWGHESCAFNKATIHINNIKAAIGCIRHLHGSKPIVSACEEFDLGFSTVCNGDNAFIIKPSLIDEVARNFANKDITQVFRIESIAPIRGDARGTSEEPRNFPALVGAFNNTFGAKIGTKNTPGFIGADAKDASEFTSRSDVNGRCRSLNIRIAGQIASIEGKNLCGLRVTADISTVIIIERKTMLAATTGFFKTQGRWVEKNGLITNLSGVSFGIIA